MTYVRGRSGSKDESSKVSSTLVAESSSSIDESADTVALQSRANKGSAPGDGSTAGLAGADELLLGVGGLGALVGLAEDGREHNELNAVVEEETQGNGRGLDGGEV